MHRTLRMLFVSVYLPQLLLLKALQVLCCCSCRLRPAAMSRHIPVDRYVRPDDHDGRCRFSDIRSSPQLMAEAQAGADAARATGRRIAEHRPRPTESGVKRDCFNVRMSAAAKAKQHRPRPPPKSSAPKYGRWRETPPRQPRGEQHMPPQLKSRGRPDARKRSRPAVERHRADVNSIPLGTPRHKAIFFRYFFLIRDPLKR